MSPTVTPTTRRTTALLLSLATVLLGLAWRLAPLHLPPLLFKYGGSALYAIMLYWLFVAALPRAGALRIALYALVTVTAIELFKLFHTPALDAFRLTLPGKLILGRIFSLGALAAYTLAIALSALIDYHRTSRIKLE